MSLRIEHRIGIAASPERIWAVIADLERWGEWNPLHPKASGRLSIGGSLDVTETLEGEAPRRAQVTVPDWTPEQQLVWTDKRGFLSNSTRYFEIEKLSETGCVLANGELFDGMRGEDWAIQRQKILKAAFEAVNAAIKARAESS